AMSIEQSPKARHGNECHGADLDDLDFASGNQLVEFRPADPGHPAGFGNAHGQCGMDRFVIHHATPSRPHRVAVAGGYPCKGRWLIVTARAAAEQYVRRASRCSMVKKRWSWEISASRLSRADIHATGR